MLGLLQDYSGDSSANLDLIQRLYSEIETRFFYDGKSVKPAFLNHASIFIPSDEKNGTWHKPDECVWQDSSDVLGDDFVYLEKHYPKLRELFVEILEVKEKVDTECFSRQWLKLQDNPISDKKEQRRLIEHLYRVLKPIAQMAEDKRPDWWDDFVNQAKFYTQLDTFEDRQEVVVPDDGELKSIFKDCDISFSWRPAKDSFNNCLYFYKASANALCLCAEHFAKWQHGAIETEDIIKQIDSYKTKSEGGIDMPILRIKLCGEDCKIVYKEKHLLELQEFLRTSDKQE